MTPSGAIPKDITRLQRPAALCALLGAIVMIVALPFDPESFFRAYLTAWFFIFSLSMGALAVVMLGYLVPGEWSLLLRRLAEAAAMNLFAVAALFIPVLFGLRWLYPWAQPGQVRVDAILQHRAAYMNGPMFTLRAAIFFAIWLIMATWLRRESLEHDRSGELAPLRRAQRISAGGLVIYFLTMTLASVDWILSRDARWYSTIIGFLVVVGQAAGGMAFLVWLVTRIAGRDPIAPLIDGKHLNDYGNLLLTLVILWAYMSFAQFLIIWMGNMRDDVSWYVDRGLGLYKNGWQYWGLMLIIFHFLVPFLVLLSRHNKRRAEILRSIAIWLLVMRFCDVIWMIMPTGGRRLSWAVVPATLALGGVWLAMFISMLRSAPLVPRAAIEAISQRSAAPHAAHAAGAT